MDYLLREFKNVRILVEKDSKTITTESCKIVIGESISLFIADFIDLTITPQKTSYQVDIQSSVDLTTFQNEYLKFYNYKNLHIQIYDRVEAYKVFVSMTLHVNDKDFILITSDNVSVYANGKISEF